MNITVTKKLGSGGSFDVWLGHDELGRQLAVKTVQPGCSSSADLFSHARALVSVRHPNVVLLHGVDQVTLPGGDAPVQAIVMEYLSGQDLAQELRAPRWTAADTLALGQALIDGVQAIHAAGIAHGDIHTQNIMIADGVLKILDIYSSASFAAATTTTLENRQYADLCSVRSVLHQILSVSCLPLSRAAQFDGTARDAQTLEDLRTAFVASGAVTETEPTSDPAGNDNFALARNLHAALRELGRCLERLTNPHGSEAPAPEVVQALEEAFAAAQHARERALLAIPSYLADKVERMVREVPPAHVARTRGGLDGWLRSSERMDTYVALLKEVERDFRRVLGVDRLTEGGRRVVLEFQSTWAKAKRQEASARDETITHLAQIVSQFPTDAPELWTEARSALEALATNDGATEAFEQFQMKVSGYQLPVEAAPAGQTADLASDWEAFKQVLVEYQAGNTSTDLRDRYAALCQRLKVSFGAHRNTMFTIMARGYTPKNASAVIANLWACIAPRDLDHWSEQVHRRIPDELDAFDELIYACANH